MTNLDAKQEAIKKAYGEHWERLNNFINEDGVFIGDTDMISDELFNEWAFIGSSKDINSEKLISGSRPKSLKGIENNNGWMRIDDFVKYTNEKFWLFNSHLNDLYQGQLFDDDMFPINRYATHYQPIKKPKQPIY